MRTTRLLQYLFAAAVLRPFLVPSPVEAQERLRRTYAQEHGLVAPPVWALAQDSVGFLWIGAEGGLFRFDGAEIRRWAPQTIDDPVGSIAVSADGRVVVVDMSSAVHEITPTGARPLDGLAVDEAPRRPGIFENAAFDVDGTLWLTRGDTLAYRTPAGEWHAIGPDALTGGRLRFVTATPFGGALLGTDSTLWRVRVGLPPERLFHATMLIAAIEPEPGRLLVLHHTPVDAPALAARVVEIQPGVERVVVPETSIPLGRAVSMVERSGTLWISLDRYLVAAVPGVRPDAMGHEAGIGSGGPLLVDREGSLWQGSYNGLNQYPEPGTRVWSEAEGLPSRHTRFVARTENTIWVATWGGAAWVRLDDDGWKVGRAPWSGTWAVCEDGRGSVWTSTGDAVAVIRDTAIVRLPGPAPGRLDGCATDRDGGMWFGTADNLLHVSPDRRVRAFSHPVFGQPGGARGALLHDSRDRVWVGAGDGICSAPAARIRAGETDAWACDALPGAAIMTAMVELPGGELWVSSNRRGLFVHEPDGWRPLPVPGAPTRTIHDMVPSPRGGIWIAGPGLNVRVEPRDSGLAVLERLTPWHGLAAGTSSLSEAGSGDLWLSTSQGLVHIPAAARFAEPAPSRIALVEARVDDDDVAIDTPLVLGHDRNRLELRFAALSYRERSRLRHQVRLSPREPWSESLQPSFRWVDLRPGAYQVEYRASLDGVNWSPDPVRFDFTVRPPWYGTAWFLLLVVALAGATVWAVYRARIAYLLGLERQRTRIAMDLHDEIGSGLASVGILSSVLASDGMAESERRRTAGEIAAAAGDLGSALSDIVWSLDPRASTMEELATRLVEHGERLCAAAETSFSARLPDSWPLIRPDVGVRRNVLLVGLEALHNAARHAQAREVVLSLLPEPAGDWVLSVHDDGVGLGTSPANGDADRANPAGAITRASSGRGLPGMRRRADEIRARLAIRSEPGQGTTITLRFPPDPRPAGPLDRVRRRFRRISGRIA